MNQNPQAAVQALAQKLAANPKLTPDVLDKLIRMFEFTLANPQSYTALRQSAIQSGKVSESDMPLRFSPTLVKLIVTALKMAQAMKTQQGYAHGGLAQLANKGRRGDSKLAHVNPFEDQLLKAYGGSGTTNPATGMPEYGFLGDLWEGVKDVVRDAAPIVPLVADFFMPGMGMMGSALLGAGSAALGGGNILQGALMGGLTKGLGGTLGSSANSALGLGLGAAGEATLGSGLAGALAGAATGKGLVQGVMQGVIGQQLGNTIGGMGQGTSWAPGMQQAGANIGNLLTGGASPQQAIAGGLIGLASGMRRPSDVVGNAGQGLSTGATGEGLQTPSKYSLTEMGGGAGLTPGADYTAPTTTSAPTGGLSSLGGNKALLGLMMASSLGGAPKPVQQAVSSMSPAQQEYFNRPSITWDWTKLQNDAAASGMGLSQYMAQNWNKVTSGAYNKQALAAGGLTALMSGGGSGRDDTIDARLSDGEYVMDAETVAMLGDGSTKEGARRLDQMRQGIRQHKGKMLARGKISPNAKSPLEYLKGVK